MKHSDFGIPEDRYPEAGRAKRRMTSVVMEATRAEPPHLVDVQAINDQDVGIWYTIEVFNDIGEQALQGWDVSRRRFVSFKWPDIVNVRSNSQNYVRATQVEWERRQMITNLQWDEDKQVVQSIGTFWRGKRPQPRPAKRIVI